MQRPVSREPRAASADAGTTRRRIRATALACTATALGFCLAFAPSCGETGTPGVRPGKLDPGTPPVTFTQPAAQALSSSVMGQSLFRFTVENTSHCDISVVKFGAVLFDGDGKRLGGDPQDVGLAGDAGDVHPGETYECTFTTGNDQASRAVVVLKEVIYIFVPEGESNAMFRVPMKWTNPAFDTEVAAAAPR